MSSINFDFCFSFCSKRIKIDYSVIIEWSTWK